MYRLLNQWLITNQHLGLHLLTVGQVEVMEGVVMAEVRWEVVPTEDQQEVDIEVPNLAVTEALQELHLSTYMFTLLLRSLHQFITRLRCLLMVGVVTEDKLVATEEL